MAKESFAADQGCCQNALAMRARGRICHDHAVGSCQRMLQAEGSSTDAMRNSWRKKEERCVRYEVSFFKVLFYVGSRKSSATLTLVGSMCFDEDDFFWLGLFRMTHEGLRRDTTNRLAVPYSQPTNFQSVLSFPFEEPLTLRSPVLTFSCGSDV